MDSAVQKQLDAAMPWVGLYIAAASAVCTLAMAADALNSIRRKKLWFPCKYTSLNAASLTVLAVAMKLPMDLNTVMINSETDAAAKFASLNFMCTALNTLMPSLGSMNDKELLANMVGVAVLVITVAANVAIHIIELQRYRQEAMIPSIMMLVSLVMLVCMALSVSTMKRSLKWKYQEKHREALEEEEEQAVIVQMDEQRRHMMKYWVMAESSCPQFVVARSNVCAASSLISSLFYCIYTLVQVLRGTRTNAAGKSLYGIYTKWIVDIQSIGLGLAVIVAALRWFVAVVFTCTCTTTFSDTLKIESYWIQTLNDWRNCLLAGFKIGPNKWGKHLLDVQWCVLTFCVGVQCCVVLVSKTLVFFSGFMVTPFASCFSHVVNKFARKQDRGTSSDMDPNLSRYVLLLDGEVELPESLVRSMCSEADRMIQIGREKRPSNLISLLRNINVSSSNSQITIQDCWTLQVVTLTSIAVALPNISEHQRKQLLSSVSQGLCLAKIVEKTLDTNAELKSIRKAASVIWVEVLVYSKWVEIDLRRAFLQCKNWEEVVQELSDKAQQIAMELNPPVRAVAANSMYTICQTILLSSCKEEEMWERLCVMIGDVLAACLTNLPHAITKMCHRSCIDGKSVGEAFLLLGKTEEVVEIIRRRQQHPSIDDEQLRSIC